MWFGNDCRVSWTIGWENLASKAGSTQSEWMGSDCAHMCHCGVRRPYSSYPCFFWSSSGRTHSKRPNTLQSLSPITWMPLVNPLTFVWNKRCSNSLAHWRTTGAPFKWPPVHEHMQAAACNKQRPVTTKHSLDVTTSRHYMTIYVLPLHYLYCALFNDLK